jgi:hypothetical protein
MRIKALAADRAAARFNRPLVESGINQRYLRLFATCATQLSVGTVRRQAGGL